MVGLAKVSQTLGFHGHKGKSMAVWDAGGDHCGDYSGGEKRELRCLKNIFSLQAWAFGKLEILFAQKRRDGSRLYPLMPLRSTGKGESVLIR